MGDPVVTAIMMVLRLGIGVILLRLALRGSRNLHWLAACFYLNFLVLFLRGPDLRVASQAVVVVIQICLAMFTHATFYQNRRSPIAWVIGGILIGGGVVPLPHGPVAPGQRLSLDLPDRRGELGVACAGRMAGPAQAAGRPVHRGLDQGALRNRRGLCRPS